jgi:hypothetical protein
VPHQTRHITETNSPPPPPLLLESSSMNTLTHKYTKILGNSFQPGKKGRKERRTGKTNENAACSKCTDVLSRCNGGEEEPAVFVTRSDEKFPFAFPSFLFDLMMKGIFFSVFGIQEGQLEAGRNPLHPLHTLELYICAL